MRSVDTRTQTTVGEFIRRYREYQGLSQVDLAILVSLHPLWIDETERGKRWLSIERLQQIAKALGVTTSHLLGEVPFMAKWQAGE